MLYLLFQTALWLFIALFVGIVIGWYLRGFFVSQTENEVQATAVDDAKSARLDSETEVVSDDWRPLGLAQRPENVDDLKRIKGIGKVIEGTLHELGIYTFKQISSFTPDNVKWVNEHISFPGRVEREGWVEQAKALADGKETDFSVKVDQGKIVYNN